MIVSAQDIRTAKRGPDGIFASVRSDCARNLQDLANRFHLRNASGNAPATLLSGEGPSKPAANPPLSDRQGNSKGGPIEQMNAFALQVGAFLDPANADHFRTLIEATYGPVVILCSDQSNRPFYRICVSHKSSRSAARELAAKLRRVKLAAGTIVVRVN